MAESTNGVSLDLFSLNVINECNNYVISGDFFFVVEETKL